MALSEQNYREMLESYRDIDEDKILAGLTDEELQQLEGEINREVLSVNHEDKDYPDDERHSLSSLEEYSFDLKDNSDLKDFSNVAVTISKTKSLHGIGDEISNSDLKLDFEKHSSLQKQNLSPGRLKLSKNAEKLLSKEELLQEVKKENTCCASSTHFDQIVQSTQPKSGKKNILNSQCQKKNRNKNELPSKQKFLSREILLQKPKLKNVYTREPAKVSEMLHGMSLRHITSNSKEKTSDDKRSKPSPSDSDSSSESCDVIGGLSINSNSVEDTVERIWRNESTLVEVNLNNIQNVNMKIFEELALAMECNNYVKRLSLANVGLTDKPTRALATMLRRNQTLEELNIESNFITGKAALSLVLALRWNQSLSELKLDNQRHIFGAKVEQEFSKILKENKTLLKFGYQFANPGPRMATSNILTRNVDDVRRKRVQEQKRRMQSGEVLNSQRQTSSERCRREYAEKQKSVKHEIKHEDSEVIQDEEVQKVLDQINPEHYQLLEQWFRARLLGDTDTVEKKDPQFQTSINTSMDNHLKSEVTIFEKHKQDNKRPSTPVPSYCLDTKVDHSEWECRKSKIDTVDHVLFEELNHYESEGLKRIEEDGNFIKNDQCCNLVHHCTSSSCNKPSKMIMDVLKTENNDNHNSNDESASFMKYNHDDISCHEFSDVESNAEKNSQEPFDDGKKYDLDISVKEKNLHLGAEQPPDSAIDYIKPTEKNDVLLWKEGDYYDSDEYEIVEVEVTDTEESESNEEEETFLQPQRGSDVHLADEASDHQPSTLRPIHSEFDQSVNQLVSSDSAATIEEEDHLELKEKNYRSTYQTHLIHGRMTTSPTLEVEEKYPDKIHAGSEPLDAGECSWVANKPFYNLGTNSPKNIFYDC